MSQNPGKWQRRTAVSVEPASGIGDTFGPDGSPATDPMIRIHEIHAIPLTRLTYPISMTIAQGSRDSNPRIFGIMHRKRGLLLLAVLLQQVEHTGPASAIVFARDGLFAQTAVRHFHVCARIGFRWRLGRETPDALAYRRKVPDGRLRP